jgi:hypothetical protein
MAWSVRLQNEHGTPVVPQDAAIESSLILPDADFVLLHYIDPYGDTIFNRVQMDDFLTDWNRVRPTDVEREQWSLVRDMALRCRDEVHLYLWFIGD